MAKVLESLVNSQLRHFLEVNNILQPQQSGFRPAHSTITAAALVVNDIINSPDNRLHCAVLFIDLSKAFDTVDHNILLSKLVSLGFDNSSINWFRNYLSGRTQAVVADGSRSSLLSVDKGVPQGSILGPLLFTLYINNIFPSSVSCNFHYYADDTILYSTGPTLETSVMNLQSAFNVFQQALVEHKLVLNPEKTKCMFFSRTHVTNKNIRIHTLENTHIETVESYKYLGIWLDSRLSFRTHIEHLINTLKKKLGFLFRNKSCFSFTSRKTIIQSTVMPVFDYGDTLNMHASSTILRSLDAVFHCALRFITFDGFFTHHCILYKKVGWSSLTSRREQHCLLFT